MRNSLQWAAAITTSTLASMVLRKISFSRPVREMWFLLKETLEVSKKLEVDFNRDSYGDRISILRCRVESIFLSGKECLFI